MSHIPGVRPGWNTVTLELREIQVGHLQRLATAKGATQDEVVASLIEREYHALRLGSDEECPWVITTHAQMQLLRILRTPETPESRRNAETTLTAACIDAYLAEREGRRMPAEQSVGIKRYRGPKPLRLTLIVQQGSLVAVTVGPHGGG